jgi:hypothetical protein
MYRFGSLIQARRRSTIIARIEGRGESGHPTGGKGVARSRQGATAIEGTSCGLGAKLEGAAVGAYAEKYRFAPGFSVGCGELEKHLIASRSGRSVPIHGSSQIVRLTSESTSGVLNLSR